MSECVHTMLPALTMLIMMPMLWNGSLLEAVRSMGKLMDRRPMFVPGGMSLGPRGSSWSVRHGLFGQGQA
jgi:hypothetical protein